MDTVSIRKEDKILMSLVHYFVTKENYSPIFVQGVKDEVWLEKLDGPYRVIRINSNKIFNNEQFIFDQFRVKTILKQIKRKTLSFTINVLNINLNEDENVTEKSPKNVDSIAFSSIEEIENNQDIIKVFPGIKDSLDKNGDGLEFIYNVTHDINVKTEKENQKYKKIFKGRSNYLTIFMIVLCVAVFIWQYVAYGPNFTASDLLIMGGNLQGALRSGPLEFTRLITYSFLHGGILHLLGNMYSLWVIGPQVESRFGSVKFIYIYLMSAVIGGLFSAAINSNVVSVGASGAIFGLLGAMIYFGLKYRLYFKDTLLSRLITLIVINLAMGFSMSGIDNACHIGGLIGGFLGAMAVGIPETHNKTDRINGVVILSILIIFLAYMALFR